MGKIATELTMSLDGFVAGPNDSSELPLGEGGMRLFDWYMSGDTEMPLPGTDMVFKVSSASADLLKRQWVSIGAMVTGRRMFDISDAWGGKPPVDGLCFVVTHNPPQEWIELGSPYIFVTDGVESAICQARQAAGDRDVSVSSASIVQQCLKLGLLDEIQINLVPYLLGGGVRLFEHFGTEPIDLEITNVIPTPVITHLIYRVIK